MIKDEKQQKEMQLLSAKHHLPTFLERSNICQQAYITISTVKLTNNTTRRVHKPAVQWQGTETITMLQYSQGKFLSHIMCQRLWTVSLNINCCSFVTQ